MNDVKTRPIEHKRTPTNCIETISSFWQFFVGCVCSNSSKDNHKNQRGPPRWLELGILKCNLICLLVLRAQSTFALIFRLFYYCSLTHIKSKIFGRCAMMQTLGMFCVRGCVNFQRLTSRITNNVTHDGIEWENVFHICYLFNIQMPSWLWTLSIEHWYGLAFMVMAIPDPYILYTNYEIKYFLFLLNVIPFWRIYWALCVRNPPSTSYKSFMLLISTYVYQIENRPWSAVNQSWYKKCILKRRMNKERERKNAKLLSFGVRCIWCTNMT